MSMGGQRNSGGSIAEINVTPLVDVLLVLLIIFMVTAPLIHEGANMKTPDPSSKNSKSSEQVDEKPTVTLNKDGSIQFRGKRFNQKSLAAFLLSSPELRKDGEIYLKADPSLKYGKVMELIGAIRRSGMDKLGLVVDYGDLK